MKIIDIPMRMTEHLRQRLLDLPWLGTLESIGLPTVVALSTVCESFMLREDGKMVAV